MKVRMEMGFKKKLRTKRAEESIENWVKIHNSIAHRDSIYDKRKFANKRQARLVSNQSTVLFYSWSANRKRESKIESARL